MVKSKEKTVLTTNNRFLLMLGIFESDQLFAEKKKTWKHFACGQSESPLMK